MTRAAFAVTAAAAALLAATQVQAHAKLVSANPAPNATVAAPKQLALRFSEKLQPKFSGFELSTGGALVPVKASIAKDRRTIVGAPTKPLAAGAYEVRWHAVTADTHRMQGTYTFTVR